MSNLSDIKRRIASVKQTRQITGAMETVSIAKMRKATERLESSRAYYDLMCDIIADIANGELFDKPASGKRLVIVLSSDRGLCGAFDHDICKLADEICDNSTVIMPIGKSACDYFKSRDNVDLRFGNANVAEYKNAERIAKELIAMYGRVLRSISVVHSSLVSRASYQPTERKILPIEPLEKKNGESRMSIENFEPSAAEVAKALAPLYVADLLYCTLAENAAAEHCARRATMSSATESADEIIDRLSTEYNRSRQSVITEQIVEISGSTEALKKQGTI